MLRNLLVPGPGEDWFLGSHINLDEISLTEFVRRFVGAFTHGGYEQELRYEIEEAVWDPSRERVYEYGYRLKLLSVVHR